MDTLVKTRTSFADYDALPETNQIVELIDGDVVMNPPNFRHQRVLLQAVFALQFSTTIGELCVAPTGLHFDDCNSFEPDLFWVSAANTNCFLEANGRYWHGAPDLVVEILSPSTELADRGKKFLTYQKYGVREYWLVNPEARFVEVYRWVDGKFEQQGIFEPEQNFESAVLNGAMIELKTWFRD